MVMAVFDLCDTLCRRNTTVDFLETLGRADPRVKRAVRRWKGPGPLFLVGALLHRLGRDLARERMVASLAGWDSGELSNAADTYAQDLMAKHANKTVVERLQTHQANSDRVVIMSSSIAPVVEAVGRLLGVEAYGSTLEFDSHRGCTGRILSDLTGRKAELAASLREGGETLIVYTDNRTDRDLLAIADVPVVILPAGRGDSHWAGEDCTYVVP